MTPEQQEAADEYGGQRLEIRLDDLGVRIAQAYALWLYYHRMPEVMPKDEHRDAMNRLPLARWVAVFCYDPAEAIKLLHSGALDVDVRPNPYDENA